MILTVDVFEVYNQKIMFIEEINYYFGIKPQSDIKMGRYQLDKNDICKIARENDPDEYNVFKQTSIHDRLERINEFDREEYIESSLNGEFTLCLHPSRVCNLNCRYCFKDSEYLGKESLNFEQAKAAIDFLTDTYAPMGERYIVDLSGSGEPLLKIDLIKQITNYCCEKRKKIFKLIGVMFASNLTLLTPEIAEYLDQPSAEAPFAVGTSIDGDQLTNDRNRIYASGKGTYEDIVNSLKLFKNKKIGTAVTLTPVNQNVDEIYDHLYRLPNVDCISMRFVRSFDGGKYDFENFDPDYLVEHYSKLCDNIIANVRAGRKDYLIMLLKGSDYFGDMLKNNILKGITRWYRCDAGRNRIVINDKGDVFACSVFYNNKDFCMGNIYTNPPSYGQSSQFWEISKQRSEKCPQCPIRMVCGGECYANGYLKHNDIFKPLDKMCEINIKLHHLSIAFLQKLKWDYPDVFKVLIDFSFKTNREHFSVLDGWIVAAYLSTHGYEFNYDKVHDSLNGVNTNDLKSVYGAMLKTVREYRPEADLYKIFPEDEMEYPAITVVNKKRYLLIVGEEGDNFKVRDSNCKPGEVLLMKKKKLVSDSEGIVIV